VVSSLLFLALTMRAQWLDLGVGVVFIVISVRMISEGVDRGKRNREHATESNVVRCTLGRKLGVGAVAGALPGLLGIGTGGIMVPAIIYMCRTTIRTAMAASLACFFVTALISASFKLGQGFIDLQAAPPLCLGALLGAHLGTSLNSRAASSTLKLLFGSVFTIVSLKFIYAFIVAMS
jgi:uncharacterized membrane protein YfcA